MTTTKPAANVLMNVLANDDPFYRYKMPPLELKNECGKTVVLNLEKVGKSLGRPSIYILKYFSYELGAQIRVDCDLRHIINGEYTLPALKQHLEKFILQFVVCGECDNPETLFKIKKKQLFKVCKACGYQGKVVDHKLTKFILKR